MTEEQTIEIPDIPGTASTVCGDTIIFVTVEHDSFAGNPLEEWEASGHIHSFNTRHCNFLNLGSDVNTQEDALEAIRQDYDDFVVLGYFEHGACDWHISGEQPFGTEGDYQWDGCPFAGIWVPDDALKAEAEGLVGEEREAKMREWAKQACEVYTQWCNGHTYWWAVATYPVRHSDTGALFDSLDDYRHDEASYEDSCGGFYGDDVLRGVKEGLEYFQTIETSKKIHCPSPLDNVMSTTTTGAARAADSYMLY
jgi:hypothetical protein